MIIHDAATTFTTLIDTAIAWIQILAGTAAILLCAAAPLIAPGVKTAIRRTTGPTWARGRLRARIHAHTRTRRSNGRTETHDYEEAA